MYIYAFFAHRAFLRALRLAHLLIICPVLLSYHSLPWLALLRWYAPVAFPDDSRASIEVRGAIRPVLFLSIALHLSLAREPRRTLDAVLGSHAVLGSRLPLLTFSLRFSL
jgi:hypothetical protein